MIRRLAPIAVLALMAVLPFSTLDLPGVFGSSDAVANLPSVLSGPLSQPLFILGTVFIVAVYFFAGGLSGLASRLGPLRAQLRRLTGAVGPGPA